MNRSSRAERGTAHRPGRALPSAASVVLVLALTLAGCGAVDRLVPPQPDPTVETGAPAAPDVAPVPAAVPSVDAIRASGTPVEAEGTVVLHVLPSGPSPTITLQTDGTETVLTLDPGDPAAPVDVLVAAPAGATLVPQDDASLVVLSADGAFLGGAGRPLMGPGTAPARLTVEPDGAVRLRGTGPITTRVGSDALVGTDWGNREGGRSLAVEPSPWARTAGLAGVEGTWIELVRAAPEADTQTMHDQLTCHALGAPDKATWNLEPWRPDIGLLMTLAASCNAT